MGDASFVAIKDSRSDLEFNKFVATGDDKVALRISDFTSLINFVWDAVVESEPDTVTEVYTFKTGGVSGTVTGTITVVYADATKARMVSAVRS